MSTESAQKTTASENRLSKQGKILDCALRIIGEQGDAGLTMRKLAECAEMRLSNLQYYFKSKDDVLAAMVELYFGECEQALISVAASCASLKRRDRAHRLITEVLKHGDGLSDMCRVFRELWAISTRNEAVREAMLRYYRRLCFIVAQSVLADEGKASREREIGSLLLPYVEGYSITAPALPMSRDEIAELLTEVVLGVIDRD